MIIIVIRCYWNPADVAALQPKTETKAERQPTFKAQNTFENRQEVAGRIRDAIS